MIQASTARFEETKTLGEELTQKGSNLDELKLIDQAKGILMRQRNLDEDEASAMLTNMAEKKNMKLADFSSQLIDAAHMLIV